MYAAPNISVCLFTKLASLLVEHQCLLTVVGRDWNSVLDLTKDKFPVRIYRLWDLELKQFYRR